MRRPNHASRFEGMGKTKLQAYRASDTQTLQSQVNKAAEKRLSLSGLEVLHGRLINVGSMSVLVEAVSHDPALVLVSGVLSFVAGLAVVRVHNHWAADWAVLVTIFGWLLLTGGLVRILFPIWLAGMAAPFSPSQGLIVGEAVVFLVIGAFLSYKAYISS